MVETIEVFEENYDQGLVSYEELNNKGDHSLTREETQ